MKVVVAHNLYRSATPSGENAVVHDEIHQLREAGIAVVPFLEDNDSLVDAGPGTKFKAAIGPVYAPGNVHKFARVLEQERPDVVHVHNTFPLISPWIIKTAHRHGIPVVHTVHNYRQTCVKGIHFRDGHVCEDCTLRKVPWPAVRHGCYRDSRAQSAAMAVGQVAHRSTWRSVDRFLALTSFMAQRICSLGVPASRVVVRPTSVPGPRVVEAHHRTVLFVGRLDEAKGVPMLMEAWRQSGASERGWCLTIAGDGPLRSEVLEYARDSPSVAYLDKLSGDALDSAYRESGCVVLPSVWYEGFPRVIAEAFSHGRPVAVSDVGSLSTIVDDSVGWRVEPTVSHWCAFFDEVPAADVRSKGKAARKLWSLSLAPEPSMELLLETYDAAVREHSART